MSLEVRGGSKGKAYKHSLVCVHFERASKPQFQKVVSRLNSRHDMKRPSPRGPDMTLALGDENTV